MFTIEKNCNIFTKKLCVSIEEIHSNTKINNLLLKS
jgi:hypothetical protein